MNSLTQLSAFLDTTINRVNPRPSSYYWMPHFISSNPSPWYSSRTSKQKSDNSVFLMMSVVMAVGALFVQLAVNEAHSLFNEASALLKNPDALDSLSPSEKGLIYNEYSRRWTAHRNLVTTKLLTVVSSILWFGAYLEGRRNLELIEAGKFILSNKLALCASISTLATLLFGTFSSVDMIPRTELDDLKSLRRQVNWQRGLGHYLFG